MFPLLVISGVIGFTLAYAPLHEPGPMYNDASFIQDVMSRINRDMDGEGGFLDFGNKMEDMSGVSGAYLPGRTPKDSEIFENADYDSLMGVNPHPAMRDQEFLQHSSLYGHKFMTGGNIENGKNSLKYKGVQPLPADVKTDATLPAYCNPPNPCPVGYTADDGCLEIFENTAPFSRAYQASQDCMCDTEHMFDCPASRDSEESYMDSSNQRDFLNELQIPSAVGTIVSSMKVSIIPALSIHMEGQHKSLVAKKFYTQKSHDQKLSRLNEMAREAAAAAAHDNNGEENVNPYLQGEKLPIAAKKGHHALHF